MIRNLIKIFAVIILVIIIFFFDKKVELKLSEKFIDSINIKYKNIQESTFVNDIEIMDIINTVEYSILNKPIKDINIYLLEDYIESHSNIDKAELYLDNDEILNVEIFQKEPLFRVFEDNKSYYLDFSLDSFSLSPFYSAWVYHVYYDKMDDYKKNVLNEIFNIINSDKFFSTQIFALEFDLNSELYIYFRTGNYKVLFGNKEEIKLKFEKFKIFYKNSIDKIDLNKFSLINLKFNNQVVCVKK